MKRLKRIANPALIAIISNSLKTFILSFLISKIKEIIMKKLEEKISEYINENSDIVQKASNIILDSLNEMFIAAVNNVFGKITYPQKDLGQVFAKSIENNIINEIDDVIMDIKDQLKRQEIFDDEQLDKIADELQKIINDNLSTVIASLTDMVISKIKDTISQKNVA